MTPLAEGMHMCVLHNIDQNRSRSTPRRAGPDPAAVVHHGAPSGRVARRPPRNGWSIAVVRRGPRGFASRIDRASARLGVPLSHGAQSEPR